MGLTTKKIIAIIPARGGSKGLPGKHIIDLAGKPLIAWTIEASLQSKYITKTVVSSDDKEILKISERYGVATVQRPVELASDTATSESVAKHTIDLLSAKNETFDVLVLLQPTSPLRTSNDIDNALGVMLDTHATAIISVFETDNKILKSFKNGAKGYIEGISNNEYPFMRRQDLPETFMPNGAIYIINIDLFKKYGRLMTNRTSCYVMPVNRSIDIDTVEDVRVAAEVLKD